MAPPFDGPCEGLAPPRASALPALPVAPAPPARRSARRHHSGLAAEDAAVRHYEARGCRVLERRLRTPEGEIDLVLDDGGMLVFAEVKQRRRGLGADSPISSRQWRRLGNAALWYMMIGPNKGAPRACRFDAAIMGPDGRLEVIENAHDFGIDQ